MVDTASAQYLDDDYDLRDSDEYGGIIIDDSRHRHGRGKDDFPSMEESNRRIRQDAYRAEMLEYQEKILREIKKQNGTATSSDYGRPVCFATGCF